LEALVDVIGSEGWGLDVSVAAAAAELARDQVCSPVVAVSVLAHVLDDDERAALLRRAEQRHFGRRRGAACDLEHSEDPALQSEGHLDGALGADSAATPLGLLPATVRLSAAALGQFKARQVITAYYETHKAQMSAAARKGAPPTSSQVPDAFRSRASAVVPLAKATTPCMPLPLFLAQWSAALPSSIAMDFKCLPGSVVLEDPDFNPHRGFKAGTTVADYWDPAAHSPSTLVYAIDTEVLHHDADTRFQQLLGFMPHWCAPALEPLVAEFAGTGCSMDQLLLRHTRAINVGPAGHSTPVYTWK
jgi:hypothetical protein